MGWTSPSTVTVGQIATAALWNTQVRDNMLALYATETRLTGIVNSDATIAAGTGFSVVHTSTGVYTVSFTSSFSATPVILCAVTASNQNTMIPHSITTSGFVLTIETLAGAVTDSAWNFIAVVPA